MSTPRAVAEMSDIVITGQPLFFLAVSFERTIHYTTKGLKLVSIYDTNQINVKNIGKV